tara:strand:- start:62 stop:544 length:483 start_codon:yes stop_codon:yes gene_type:complete
VGTSRLKFRTGSVRDTKKVIELCDTWWYESAWYKNTKMKFTTTPEYWYGLFQMGSIVLCVGENEAGEMKAAYVGMKQPYLFNHDYTTATEVVWCIDEEYRTGENLVTLLSEIEKLLKNEGVHMYNLNLPVEDKKEKLADSLVKRGFFRQDLSLFKEIEHG